MVAFLTGSLTMNEKKKKLSLTVRDVSTLESRASPHTLCPDNETLGCVCPTTVMNSQKLTAVAFF